MAVTPKTPIPASELGYYVKDRFNPKKRFYIHDYLCIEHNGEIKKIRIDRFAIINDQYFDPYNSYSYGNYISRFNSTRYGYARPGSPLFYNVPVDLLNEFLPKDAYLRQLMIKASANKYLVIKKGKFCAIKIPLILIDESRVYYMDTMVSREGKTIERPTKSFYHDNYWIRSSFGNISLEQLKQDKDKTLEYGGLPDMLVYEGEDKEYVDKYINPDDVSFHKEILQRAFNAFMREMDSGIHIKIGDYEYMVPSTDKYFTWYAKGY